MISTLATRIARSLITHPSAAFSTIASRPFRILGLQQVAIGSVHKDSLKQLWGDILGVPTVKSGIEIASENVNEDILQLGTPPHAVEIDLMSPIDAEKSPKVHVPPLNHIGLWVDDLETAVSWMTEKGVRFTPGGIRVGAAGHRVAFIHPKANEKFPIAGNGVLLELVQAPDDVIAAHNE